MEYIKLNSNISDLEQQIFFILGFIFKPIIYLIILTEELINEYYFRKEIKNIRNDEELSKDDKEDIISVLEMIRYGERFRDFDDNK